MMADRIVSARAPSSGSDFAAVTVREMTAHQGQAASMASSQPSNVLSISPSLS